MIRHRTCSRIVELTGAGVALDFFVKASRLIFVEPRPQPVELARPKPRDRLFCRTKSGQSAATTARKPKAEKQLREMLMSVSLRSADIKTGV
jgi:hypothetical protein